MEPRIFTTKEWGARKVDRAFELNRAQGIVVHHTAGNNRTPAAGEQERTAAFALARAIQADHMDRNGWADSGQHFLVSRGGIVLESRTGSLFNARKGFVVRGAHAGVSEGNTRWYGIEIEGNNMGSFKVTDAQWKSLVELCAWLSATGEFQSQNIRGHQQFVATDCPGTLMGRLPQLRKEVRDRKIEILDAVGVG